MWAEAPDDAGSRFMDAEDWDDGFRTKFLHYFRSILMGLDDDDDDESIRQRQRKDRSKPIPFQFERHPNGLPVLPDLSGEIIAQDRRQEIWRQWITDHYSTFASLPPGDVHTDTQ